MANLMATREILYQGRMYLTGETLPCHDAVLAQAWLDAGSARDIAKKPATESAEVVTPKRIASKKSEAS